MVVLFAGLAIFGAIKLGCDALEAYNTKLEDEMRNNGALTDITIPPEAMKLLVKAFRDGDPESAYIFAQAVRAHRGEQLRIRFTEGARENLLRELESAALGGDADAVKKAARTLMERLS